MRKTVCITLVLAVMACSKTIDKGFSEQHVITEREVHTTIKKWAEGMLENNPETIDAVLHDGWMYSGSDNGSTTNKTTAMDDIRPGKTTLKQIFLSDTIIRVYKNMAIITGKEELVFVTNQDTSRIFLRFTDVFIKENGEVQAVSTHSSPIKPKSE